jgi:alkylation response protein AidB-like acyl-CoA dehydrogenase
MDFAFSDDQLELRSTARRWLADRLPPARIHELADEPDRPGAYGGHDAILWAELVGLGWVGVSTPGGGGGFLDEAVLLEEAGLALLPAPLLSSVVATPALVAAGAGTGATAGAGAAAGSAAELDATRRTAVAWGELRGPASFGSPAEIACRAEAQPGGGWLLTGTKSDVADLGAAEQAVVLARTPEGPGVFIVELAHRADPAPVIGLLETTDGTRRIGQLVLDGVPATALAADSPGVPTVLTAMRRRALAGLALESVGVAQWALDAATAHAGQREQFGRVIGTYQAISHRVADVYVQTELARSLAYRAAWFVATSETEPGEVDPTVVDSACAAAKSAAGEAAVFATEAAIQVLGGIGMTWEHLAHRYYKRALANRTYAGGPAEHRATVAAALLDG